jgi:hypothetical protein
MEIIIDGWRAGGEDRKQAQLVPASKLPLLSEAQKEVARKTGISEEDYARSAFAGKLNQDRLLEKTKQFSAILEDRLRSKAPGARIERIRLLTIEHEYRIEIYNEHKIVLFRVAEDMVDDFMEKGFAEVGQRIEQNLETVLAVQAVSSKHGQA